MWLQVKDLNEMILIKVIELWYACGMNIFLSKNSFQNIDF